MDEATRLELIVEAVRYCQHVKATGMPTSCFTKAPREPVYFRWECRDGASKERRPPFRSTRAIGVRVGKGTLIYDHAVPFKYLQDELLSLANPTARKVANILNRRGIVVLITREEDRRLSKEGYRSKMPDDWDGVDPLARYKTVGIELVENVGGAS